MNPRELFAQTKRVVFGGVNSSVKGSPVDGAPVFLRRAVAHALAGKAKMIVVRHSSMFRFGAANR